MKLLGPLLIASSSVLALGCTGHDDPSRKTTPQTEEPETPDPPPPEAPPLAEKVQVAVASVQLQDDCPTPKPASPKVEPPASMAPEPARGDMADEPMPRKRSRSLGQSSMAKRRRPSCVQSRVTLSIESEADEALPFAVKAARLRVVDGKRTVGEMTTRSPQIWAESKYEGWDERIEAGGSLQVSYALGSPNWSEVENAIEQPSSEPLYVIEFDVEVAGEVRTVVSPVAPRDEPHNIVT